MQFLALFVIAWPLSALAQIEANSELSSIMSSLTNNLDARMGRTQFQTTLNAMYTGLVENVPLDNATIPTISAGPGSFSYLNGTLQQTLWQSFQHWPTLKNYFAYEDNGTFIYYGNFPSKLNAPIYSYMGDWLANCPTPSTESTLAIDLPATSATTAQAKGFCRTRYYVDGIGIPTKSFCKIVHYYDLAN